VWYPKDYNKIFSIVIILKLMERSDSTIRLIRHSRGSPDPYEHSHVGPQLDDDGSATISG
jgi:hypothetical protein